MWNRFTTLLVTSVLKKQCSLDEANLVGPWPVLAWKGFFTSAVGAGGAVAGGAIGIGAVHKGRPQIFPYF